MALTLFSVQNAKPMSKPYKLADGNGLHLLINPNGSKLWRLRYRFAGTQKMIGLGAFPDVPLSAARDKAHDARKLVAAGNCLSVMEAFDACSLRVLELETTIFSFPEIEWPVARLSMKEQVDLRRFLRAKEYFLANEDRVSHALVLALANVFGGLIKELPPISEGLAAFFTAARAAHRHDQYLIVAFADAWRSSADSLSGGTRKTKIKPLSQPNG